MKIASASTIDPHRQSRERLEANSPLSHAARINPTSGTADWYFASKARPARTPLAPHQRRLVGALNASSKHQAVALTANIMTVLWLNR
jgi:hypothetical protein